MAIIRAIIDTPINPAIANNKHLIASMTSPFQIHFAPN